MVMNFYKLIVLVFQLSTSMVSSSEYPVNRMITVDAGRPTPDLACIVGFQSIESEDLFKTNCSQAHNFVLNINREIRKTLKWPLEKRTLRKEFVNKF